MTTSSEEATYLTDHWTLEDALSFSDFRPALENILKTAETPLTVGIFGPWGSGKTSLMRMLRDQFESEDDPSVRTVWFTAWKYDRHEVLWRAFILRVLDALYPREPGEGPREDRLILQNPSNTQKKLIELLERLEESVYQAVDWEEIGRRAINWSQFIGHTAKAGVETAASISSAGVYLVLKNLLGGDDTPLDDVEKAAKAISRETKAYHRRQLFHMEEFEATFKEAIELIPEKRLVIFVDDLDRCLPEKAIEVLEAIKLFLEVPRTVFVLGMDQDVIQHGVEARYGSLFRRELGDRSELPIRGDVYLQKIVQIPFYLPAMGFRDVNEFIEKQDKRLPELARQVFARGLFPNPRTVKRALNIFGLLQQIALTREEQERLPKEAIAWPLLAKTIVIQTQYPDLYKSWRQYPTLIQTLEAEYSRRQWTEEETLLGRLKSRSVPTSEGETLAAAEEEPAERTGGLLAPYLENQAKYPLLAQMLAFPTSDAGKGRERARFAGLNREQMAAYLRLAGVAESKLIPLEDVPVDLLDEMLSGDQVRIQDAVARLREKEAAQEGSLHQASRKQLLEVMNSPQQPAKVRTSAGNALALVGDPRFRADAWFLPDEPLLGFVEVPKSPFLMGSDKDKDPAAYDDELPQHEVNLPTYYIARYPVTMAQFRAFVEDRNYKKDTDLDALRRLDNHPIVWVTWHEAVAYCDWLTKQLRQWSETPEQLRTLLQQGEEGNSPWRVILPSEAEWEKAARGSDGRIFPWGDEFDPQKANTKATGIRMTSSVGCFPMGASPHGLMDMSGNTWEWTRSLWGEHTQKPDYKYPYQPEDGRENLEAPDAVLRVLRGGSFYTSFYSGEKLVRAAVRHRSLPDVLGGGGGFRLAVSVPGRVLSQVEGPGE